MERNILWCTSGHCIGSYIFLLYINDLTKFMCDLSKPILFAHDISIILSDKDTTNFKIKTNKLFDIVNE
jgi:hypothetical protein